MTSTMTDAATVQEPAAATSPSAVISQRAWVDMITWAAAVASKDKFVPALQAVRIAWGDKTDTYRCTVKGAEVTASLGRGTVSIRATDRYAAHSAWVESQEMVVGDTEVLVEATAAVQAVKALGRLKKGECGPSVTLTVQTDDSGIRHLLIATETTSQSLPLVEHLYPEIPTKLWEAEPMAEPFVFNSAMLSRSLTAAKKVSDERGKILPMSLVQVKAGNGGAARFVVEGRAGVELAGLLMATRD